MINSVKKCLAKQLNKLTSKLADDEKVENDGLAASHTKTLPDLNSTVAGEVGFPKAVYDGSGMSRQSYLLYFSIRTPNNETLDVRISVKKNREAGKSTIYSSYISKSQLPLTCRWEGSRLFKYSASHCVKNSMPDKFSEEGLYELGESIVDTYNSLLCPPTYCEPSKLVLVAVNNLGSSRILYFRDGTFSQESEYSVGMYVREDGYIALESPRLLRKNSPHINPKRLRYCARNVLKRGYTEPTSTVQGLKDLGSAVAEMYNNPNIGGI